MLCYQNSASLCHAGKAQVLLPIVSVVSGAKRYAGNITRLVSSGYHTIRARGQIAGFTWSREVLHRRLNAPRQSRVRHSEDARRADATCMCLWAC